MQFGISPNEVPRHSAICEFEKTFFCHGRHSTHRSDLCRHALWGNRTDTVWRDRDRMGKGS